MINTLPPEKLLLLPVLAGEKTEAKAAEQLGVTQGTVNNRKKKLVDELRELLAE